MNLRRNLAWMGLAQGSFFVIQFGASVVLARILSPRELGIFAVAGAVVGLLSLIQAFGLGSYIVREATLERKDVATAFTLNTILSVALFTATLALAFAAGGLFEAPGVTTVLMVLAWLPLIGIFQFVPHAQLERGADFPRIALGNTIRQLTATTLTLFLAFKGHSYMSLAYGQLAGAVVGAVFINLVGRQHVAFHFSLRGWKKISAFGTHMIMISGMNTLSTRGSDIVLGKIGGLAELGLFSRATTLFTLFWENLHIVIGRVLFSDLSNRKRTGGSLREPYLKIASIIMTLLWPAFAGMAVLSHPLFFHVYGPQWTPAALPFALIALAGVVQLSISMTWEVFTISGETKLQSRIEVMGNSIGFTIFVVGCFFGLLGAATAKLIQAVMMTFFYRRHLQRMTDTTAHDFALLYMRSGLMTLLAIAPAIVLMVVWRGAAAVPLWQVAASIAAGIVLWGAGLLITRHPLLAEAQRVLSRLGAARRS